MGPEHLTWISLSSGESKLRLEHKLRELVSESVANSHERNTEIGQSFGFAGFIYLFFKSLWKTEVDMLKIIYF